MPARILHTSDWHVGKAIRGASRADEHRAVLAEIVDVATTAAVDLVLVAGDLFDSASPSPESEQIVYEGLLALARTGATVAVIAGNHDNARGLRAVAPLLELGNVHVVTEPRRPDDGGLLGVTTADGTPVRVSMLPFVSKRGIVRAGDLMAGEAFEHAQRYSERMRLLLEAMCAPFRDDAVNVLVAHTFVVGAAQGGGERPAHLVDEYAVTAASFPATIGYGALGHLHRAQRIAAGAPLHYCGSPLHLDFGETHGQQVNVVTTAPGTPADVRAVPLTAGRRLHTARGTLDELTALQLPDDPWLRVVVRGPRRAGLADDVRELLGPRVVEVRIDAHDPAVATSTHRRDHRGRSPQALFGEFLATQGVADPRIEALFADLLDDSMGLS